MRPSAKGVAPAIATWLVPPVMSVGVRTAARAAILLASVVLVALALAVMIVRLPSIQRWVGARVAARLPAGITIDRASLMLLPPGVTLADVSLSADGPTLKSVSCSLRLSALLTGRVEVESILVDGATLAIERTAAGPLQVAGPLAVVLGATPTTSVPAPPSFTLADLPSVTATNATITFTDHAARGAPTLRLRDVRLTIGEPTATGVPITAAARLEPAGSLSAEATVRSVGSGSGSDLTVTATAKAAALDAQTMFSYLAAVGPGGGTARAEGTLDGSLTIAGSLARELTGAATVTQASGTVIWDEIHLVAPFALSTQLSTSPQNGVALSAGRFTVTQVDAGPMRATAINAAFAYDTDTLHLLSAQAAAFGGSWTQSGTVTLDEPPIFNVALQAEGVDCEALLVAITGARPRYGCESLSAGATVHGVWTGAESVAQRAEGDGHIELRGGSIPASSILGAVWEALLPIVRVGSRSKAAFEDPARATHVDHLTQSFTLNGGRMRTGDLSLVTDDYVLSGTGVITLDGRLDLNTEVAMTPAGLSKLFVLASLPMPGDVGRFPPIPTTITGTLSDPAVRPQVLGLPFGAVSTLFHGARSAGQAMGTAAGDGWRALERGIESKW